MPLPILAMKRLASRYYDIIMRYDVSYISMPRQLFHFDFHIY